MQNCVVKKAVGFLSSAIKIKGIWSPLSLQFTYLFLQHWGRQAFLWGSLSGAILYRQTSTIKINADIFLKKQLKTLTDTKNLKKRWNKQKKTTLIDIG